MTTDQKGAIAEAKIIAAALELGIPVLQPFGDGLRYDLVFDLGVLVRVQCKWASRRGETLIVPLRSCRRGPDGFIRTRYTAAEVDAVSAFAPDTGRCYFLPMAEVGGRSMVALRLAASRNNQQAGIRWAKDYEFAATLGQPGAIAQLGERLHGMQEVAGSSPAGSTSQTRLC
jgi:hypothetical protein